MTCMVDKVIAGINATTSIQKVQQKSWRQNWSYWIVKIVSLVDLSATSRDKGCCLAEHDHLENYKCCWFKDKIKGLESKAELDIKMCIVDFPEGKEVCIPVKWFREMLSASGHSCTPSTRSCPGCLCRAVRTYSRIGRFSGHHDSGRGLGTWQENLFSSPQKKVMCNLHAIRNTLCN